MRTNSNRNRKIAAMIACLPLSPLMAQDYSAISSKYPHEHAVYTNITEHLTIKNEKGNLVASTEITQDKLLLTDRAPQLFNTEYIYHGYFYKLEDIDAKILIPSSKGDYKTSRSYSQNTRISETNNVFYDDSKQTELTFTGLVKNAVIETSYTLSHRDLGMLPTVYFQESIPTVQSTYIVTAPKNVDLRFVLKGKNTGNIKQTKEESKNSVTYTFTGTDIAAMKAYDDAPAAPYYVPHIITYIAAYTEARDDKKVELTSDPAHLYKYMYRYIQDVNRQTDPQMVQTVAELTKDDHTVAEKAAHIYAWVQSNMHYIAFEDSLGGFIPRQASDIYHRRFGDCKDMSSILTAMCTIAGIDAHFVWIGTRDKPYVYEETPLPIVNNHMICAIKNNGSWTFLDGTNPLIPFGKIPGFIQGKEAMIAIDAGHFEIVKIPETPAVENVISDTTHMHIEDKKVAGTLRVDYKGYPAWDLQSMMMYYKNDDRDKFVLAMNNRGSNKFFQSKYDYTENMGPGKDAMVTSDFSIDDYVQHVDKECFVNLNLQHFVDNTISDIGERTAPITYKYKRHLHEVVVLDIPKGYTATYVPADAQQAMGDAMSYKISYKVTPTAVTLIKDYELNTLSVEPEKFNAYNKFVEDLKKQYKESIVLTAQ